MVRKDLIMGVNGSPTQQNMDGSQVNRRRGNRCTWPRTARLNTKRVSRESESTVPFYNVDGVHKAYGRDGRVIYLPNVIPNEKFMITSRNARARSRRLKKLSSHDLRYQTVSWNEDVPLKKLKLKAVKKAKAEPKFKAHTGEDNPELDILGGACETVSGLGWRVIRANLQPHGKHYTAQCILSNGDYQKSVIIENVRDEEDLLDSLHKVHRATV